MSERERNLPSNDRQEGNDEGKKRGKEVVLEKEEVDEGGDVQCTVVSSGNRTSKTTTIPTSISSSTSLQKESAVNLDVLSGNNNKETEEESIQREFLSSFGQFGPTTKATTITDEATTKRSTACSITTVLSPPTTSNTLLEGFTEGVSQLNLQVPSLKNIRGSQEWKGPLLTESYFEEEADVILNCQALSLKVLGRMKSFSTSDITDNFLLSDWKDKTICCPHRLPLRTSVSEIVLSGESALLSHLESQTNRRLTSRSCSTWVAVGDQPTTAQLYSSNSQLHSPALLETPVTPGGGVSIAESIIGSTAATAAPSSALISPIGFVRSVNKKVREMYIRKRIVSTYRALERLSKSQFDLTSFKAPKSTRIERLASSPSTLSITTFTRRLTSPPASPREEHAAKLLSVPLTEKHVTSDTTRDVNTAPRLILNWDKIGQDISSLTVRDIEQQKGKPLSKYDRNMMIFNWLQELDEAGSLTEQLATVS
jgi:hypothetical protein